MSHQSERRDIDMEAAIGEMRSIARVPCVAAASAGAAVTKPTLGAFPKGSTNLAGRQ